MNLLRKWGGVAYRTFYARIAPRKAANSIYKKFFGHGINWENPTDLNEWINVLKFSENQRVWAGLADKYAVRDYVASKGLENMLVKLYGVWDNPDKIEFDALPDSFVLKSNHGSGTVKIVKDKKSIDCDALRRECRKWLKTTIGYYGVEPHYTYIPRKIIVEELLDCAKQSVISSSLIDYKIWCFKGKPYCVFVIANRQNGNFEMSCYDTSWHVRNDMLVYNEHHLRMMIEVPRPKTLETMLMAAERLAVGHPQVRVDLYEVNDKPYFGELTFTSNGGYMQYFTQDALKEMGALLN